MDFRKATLNDAASINTIAQETWPVAYKNILTEDQVNYMLDMMYSIPALHRQMEDSGHIFYLAYIDGVCIGFISFEINTNPGITKIHKFYVLPGVQARGVGRAFIEFTGNKAKEAGNTALTLNVNRFNTAVNFYLKTGFTITGEEDIDIGSGYLMEDYIMQKPL